LRSSVQEPLTTPAQLLVPQGQDNRGNWKRRTRPSRRALHDPERGANPDQQIEFREVYDATADFEVQGLLAEISSMSCAHCARLFKESTGVGPHQYATAQRVERARGLYRERGQGIAVYPPE
jgi:methylphosphotriester-DNA--protein-cysteine methyltransferase